MSVDPIKRSQYVRITDRDENITVGVTDNDELKVDDTPDSGDSTTQTINTTASVANVSGFNRADRKVVELMPLDGVIFWGYDSSCPFRLARRQFASIDASENLDVYYKANAGTVDVAVGEK